MDLAYDPHAETARRRVSSATNLGRLTLAPLTTKLPLSPDDEAYFQSTSNLPPPPRSTSYLQGKSAPSTPRLLSRTPVTPRLRSHSRTPSAPGVKFGQSKSTTHLGSAAYGYKSPHGATTPRRKAARDDGIDVNDRNDSDWIMRTGALMTSESREAKGQSWLLSRESSTSLAGLRADDEDEDAFETELARERSSRHASRRPSLVLAEDEASPYGSRYHSRLGSRSHSVTDMRNSLVSPMERMDDESYFTPMAGMAPGPDFVNLDEKLEELQQDTVMEDEAAVKRLVRYGQSGTGSWISNMIGFSLFSLDERDEESEGEYEDEDESVEYLTSSSDKNGWSRRHFEGISNVPEEKLPPPSMDDGAWKDAAWLLSVASKVMF